MKLFLQYMTRKKLLLLATTLTLLISGASPGVYAQDSTAGKTVSQKRFQRMAKKKNAVLLDVRTPGEFKEGHIPGSLQLNVQNSEEFNAGIATLDKKKTYLLYCRSGKRSNQAKLQMKAAGFKKLFDLEGGFSQWQGAKAIQR
ncbi:MAG TPA: rhodanese-like domain-containing protein [Chitinophagaceae bacterium]|nr:rhodanese-like domain-containing protein [Chitinophagaceae bacterium]